tara:strand:+ start:37861 stop:38250 length:390 start_codon:yes stop_codon:yes gene_type:complete
MTVSPYLIAISLVEEGNKRAMPLGGKSLKSLVKKNEDPPENLVNQIALELCLRLLQKSDQNFIKRSAGDNSFLIVQIPLKQMNEELPLLKSRWLKSGDTKNFISEIKKCSLDIWKMNFVRYEGIKINKL